MKVCKRYQSDFSDILKVKAIDLPANSLMIKNHTSNECRVKDTNISSRKSRVSPGKFITLTSFDVAVIAVAIVIVVVVLAIVLQKNRSGKIRIGSDKNNRDSHRVDNDPNCHENLSELNSLSEKNVATTKIKKITITKI